MIGGESEGGQRSGENDAEWPRTRRGNVGFRWSCVGARGWQVGGWHREGSARGKGRHKGVDKVAIVHGTQLHAPALPPVLQASPFFHPPARIPPPISHPIGTLVPASATPGVARPTALSQRSAQPTREPPSPLALLSSPGSRSPLGIAKRTTPLDPKREISQTTRWQRCSCRELLALDASTNLRSNPPAGPHVRSEILQRTLRYLLPLSFNPPALFFAFLFVACPAVSLPSFSTLAVHTAANPARLNRTAFPDDLDGSTDTRESE